MKLSNAPLFDRNLPLSMVREMESISGLSFDTLMSKVDALNNKAEWVELFLDRLDDEGKALLSTEGLEVSVVSNNHLYDLLPDPKFDFRNVAMGTCQNILYVNVDLDFGKAINNATLHHEMTHFDQFRRGDLRSVDAHRKVKWKGKTFEIATIYQRMAQGEQAALVEYHRLPWEEEADAAFFQYLLVHHAHVIDDSRGMQLAKESWERFNGWQTH